MLETVFKQLVQKQAFIVGKRGTANFIQHQETHLLDNIEWSGRLAVMVVPVSRRYESSASRTARALRASPGVNAATWEFWTNSLTCHSANSLAPPMPVKRRKALAMRWPVAIHVTR
jgi:hypothetical protein